MHEHGSQEPFTGKAVSYHDRQKDHLAAEIDVVSGKPHGYAEYYPDGSKKTETKLVDGEEMYTITWHRNGQKESEKTWVDGKHIATTFWYESGEKAETHYYPGSLSSRRNGKRLIAEIPSSLVPRCITTKSKATNSIM